MENFNPKKKEEEKKIFSLYEITNNIIVKKF